jgi:hypothetical protein
MEIRTGYPMETNKLRIAMLSVHSCPVGELGARDTGGMSVYIRELARELGRQGHLVDIYTRVHDPDDPRMEELGEGVRLIHLNAGREAKIQKLDVYFSLPEFTWRTSGETTDSNTMWSSAITGYRHWWANTCGSNGGYLTSPCTIRWGQSRTPWASGKTNPDCG